MREAALTLLPEEAQPGLGGESVVYSPDVAVPAAVSCSGFAVELQTKFREDFTLVESAY